MKLLGLIIGAISLGLLVSVMITLFSDLEHARADRERCMEVVELYKKAMK